MQTSLFLSAPYEWIEPLLPALVCALVALCLAGIAIDLATSEAPSRGRLASLCGALALVAIGRGWFALDSWAATGFVLAAYAVLIAHTARFGWTRTDSGEAKSPVWVGLAVVLIAVALECVALGTWPANLNTYAAMTGEEGLKALEGNWPSPFYGIRDYPLAGGGQSPLHLPILWTSMKVFGGTVFAVRFAEVVGSAALLLVLWMWLRTALPGIWAPVALALFAFSPWQLMQARFGSFYCVSAALALALLWLAERTRGDGRHTRVAWLALGAGAGMISWAYAPLQVLYAFFAVVVAAGFLRARHRWEPLLAVAAFALIVGLQLSQSGRSALMRSSFGHLATDTVIWHKNTAHAVTPERQPLTVIVDNFARNVDWWFRDVFEQADILVWWAPALGLGVLYALVDLARPSSWTRSAYYLIGMLPPLLIFPLNRRTLIVWPLVYFAGARFCRDLVAAAKSCRWQPWTQRLAAAVIGAALILASLRGLRSYAVGNPAGLVYPYFGPVYRHLMIEEAERLLPRYHLLFVNPEMLSHAIAISMYEPARATQRPHPYDFVTIGQQQTDFSPLVPPGRKNCFVYINDQPHAWVSQRLRAGLPGGQLVEGHGEKANDPPAYFLYFFPSE